jgi:hypothetical protein
MAAIFPGMARSPWYARESLSTFASAVPLLIGAGLGREGDRCRLS